MRKIISLLAAVLLCTTLLYPQAAVDIPLILSDGINNPMTLYFGLDLTATNGIDPQLGEGDVSGYPLPPQGIFEVRFDLTPYAGTTLHSYKDYRNAPAFPFTGQRQHRLIWQLGYLGSFLSINYNLPDYAIMQIQDELGGIVVNSPNLTDSGTFIIIPPIYAVRVNITYTNALPVELTSFTGKQEGSTVKLNWTTASEINNKGFDVERKTQNSAWDKAAFIEGYGTTTEIHSYSYTDDLSKTAVTYPLFYRLKQIDYDGTVSYSEELKIEAAFTPTDFVLEQNYPNPFNPTTKIRYSVAEEGLVNLSVYDLMGQKAAELKNEVLQRGNYETVFDASSLSSGVYVYKLNAEGKCSAGR